MIISAPSGAGKSTVCRRLRRRNASLKYSVSTCTRKPRPSEVEGRHYRFISVPEFRRRIRRGEFIEWARVHGNYYGTPKGFIAREIRAGNVVLLDIDVKGAGIIRRRMRDAVTIFLLPPSWSSLERRLRLRGDTDDAIGTRLANARKEFAHAKRYDYWVVNDVLATAVREVEAIILAERLRSRRRPGGRARLANLTRNRE
ncbi:MAG: guanylate kinase [Elusimicrobiota bacterium]